ncbi:hypothetical protein OIDMADRAFT_27332 [Oidiodendron maius Zn]|uniref:TLC domain-containing protein n=1 Tax=Oidiodendron maius (strain Zn) TaxID=913774 RepID=A0A0C3CV15_OIDMZ|nr:hypothetical protein OIDMADRAFT_27332 [Oidiodendron maius Zn]
MISTREKAQRKGNRQLENRHKWIVEHQISLSASLLVLLGVTYMWLPRAHRHTREYRVGFNDAFMVLFWVIIFTGLRAVSLEYILMPLAKKGGIKTARKCTRFSEQAWLLIYYSVFWMLGMVGLWATPLVDTGSKITQYLLTKSNYLFDLKELWTNWPNRDINGLQKSYTLVQYAFWLQQIMLAKCLKYLGFTTICDILFGVFMVTWIAARHIMYLRICWSIYTDIPNEIRYGCYRGKNDAIMGPFPSPPGFSHLLKPFWDPEGIVCWNNKIKWAFLFALLFLQCIMLVWFSMIVKVAIAVLRSEEADDTRSGDEADSEDQISVKAVPPNRREPHQPGEAAKLLEKAGCDNCN